MTYLRRAVKYFLQILLIFAAIIGILMLSGMVSKDVAVAFRNGWTSVWWILGMFAAMSLVYPYFGYGKRIVRVNGDPAPMWPAIDQAMEARGYVNAGVTEDGGRKYHLSNQFTRATRMWEDTLTIKPVLGGFEIEGPTRDLSRAVMSLDRKINE